MARSALLTSQTNAAPSVFLVASIGVLPVRLSGPTTVEVDREEHIVGDRQVLDGLVDVELLGPVVDDKVPKPLQQLRAIRARRHG